MRCFRCDRYIPTSMTTFVATVEGQQSNTGPHKMVVSALLCHDCGVHVLSDLKGNGRDEKNFTFNVSTKELNKEEIGWVADGALQVR